MKVIVDVQCVRTKFDGRGNGVVPLQRIGRLFLPFENDWHDETVNKDLSQRVGENPLYFMAVSVKKKMNMWLL